MQFSGTDVYVDRNLFQFCLNCIRKILQFPVYDLIFCITTHSVPSHTENQETVTTLFQIYVIKCNHIYHCNNFPINLHLSRYNTLSWTVKTPLLPLTQWKITGRGYQVMLHCYHLMNRKSDKCSLFNSTACGFVMLFQ